MADEILEKMRGQYEHRFRNDQKLKRIRKKLQNGANQAVAQEYAVAAGEILSDVLKENVTADLFGETMPDAAILAGLIIPMMEQNYTHVVSAASASQKYMNSEGNLGMKPIEPEFDRNAAMNIVGRMANYDSFEDAEWLMDEPIRTNSQHIADESLRENAEFQYRSGLKPKIVREAESGACEWCQELADTYDYEDVSGKGDPIYQRHNNCKCEITFVPGEGRSEEVDPNQWRDEDQVVERILYSREEERDYKIQVAKSKSQYMTTAMSGDNIGSSLKTPGQREIETAIKEQMAYSGKNNLIAEAIVKNHYDLKYISPERMYNLLVEAGFDPIPLANSTHGFNGKRLEEGGGYVASLGKDGGSLEYHPVGGLHEINYFRISSGQTGKHWYDTDGKEFVIGRGGKPEYIDL